jgi:arsenite-transporting ATPase
VGKTTVAAATALRCADAGLRTLALSTDPAHSLADALAVHLDSSPISVVDNLFAEQLDATERFEEAWCDVQRYLLEIMDWAGVDDIEAEELSIIPGLDEIFSLTDIKRYAASGAWDVLIVDCAPTAETIRLLSLPDILSWYMERLFPVGRRVTRAARPLLSRLASVPIANDAVFAAIGRLYERLDGVREVLTDPDTASVRLVINPERIVIAEARRTATYLSLFGYRVDAVIANRLLPDEISDPWFKSWKDIHAEHLAAIEEGFAPVPVLRADLTPAEPVGIDALRQLATALYGEVDAAAVLHRHEPLKVEACPDGYLLRLALPFVEREDLDVGRQGADLHVRVGPHRRSLLLPDSLSRRPIVRAKMDEQGLQVLFGGLDRGSSRPERTGGIA